MPLDVGCRRALIGLQALRRTPPPTRLPYTPLFRSSAWRPELTLHEHVRLADRSSARMVCRPGHRSRPTCWFVSRNTLEFVGTPCLSALVADEPSTVTKH